MSTRRRPRRAPRTRGRAFVDHEFFDDRADDVSEMKMRRGARVKHERFGEGQVVKVVSMGEPAGRRLLPGLGGEKKILARFLAGVRAARP